MRLYEQQQAALRYGGTPSLVESAVQSSSKRVPFDTLMTGNQDPMHAALDQILREHKRQAGDRATQAFGFQNVPETGRCLADQPSTLGIARAGGY